MPPQYLDANGNLITTPPQKVYLDPNTGEPAQPKQYTASQATGSSFLGGVQNEFDKAMQTVPVDIHHGVSGFASSVGSDLGAGAMRLLTPLVHPWETAKGLAQTGMAAAAGPGSAPMQDLAAKTIAPFVKNPSGEAVAAIPQAALALAGGGEAAPATKAIEDSGEGGGILTRSPVSGENFTSPQLRSHAAVIAEGTAGGDPKFIPQTLATQTGSILRQTAAQNPTEVQAINSGDPLAAYQAHISLLKKAQGTIDTAHESVLKPYENYTVNTKGIQDAITPGKFQAQGMDPADLSAIDDLKARAANVTNLRGLNEFRMTMNSEDATLGRNLSPSKTVGYPDLVHDMANTTRNAYYDALKDASGQDFSGIKRVEGGLLTQIKSASALAPKLATSEAKANAPFQLRPALGDIVEGTTRTGQPGLPIVGGIANKVGEAIRGTKASQIQTQLQNFYSNLPKSPTVPLPTAPVPLGASRQLPQQAGSPYQLPYYPQMSQGENTAAMMQQLRQRQQLGLPGVAMPRQLPAPQ